VSALTGTPPHKKESASPPANRISSAWNYGHIHETYSSTKKKHKHTKVALNQDQRIQENQYQNSPRKK
jgi:hypothetical protein